MLMIKRIPAKTAIHILIWILIVLFFYHILIVTGEISFQSVWGGRLQSEQDMVRFESIAILLNLLMLIVVFIKGGYINIPNSRNLICLFLWIFGVMFILNALGSAISQNPVETWLFTPLALLSSLLCIRLALTD